MNMNIDKIIKILESDIEFLCLEAEENDHASGTEEHQKAIEYLKNLKRREVKK